MDELRLGLALSRELLDQEQASGFETHDPLALRAQLDLALREQGRPLAEVVENLRQVVALTPKSGHHRFLNQLYGGRDALATAAEIVAAAANTQMHTFKVAGPQVLVEQAVLRRMRRLAGYPGGEGTFTPGGSIANLVAMTVARNQAIDGAREDGLPAERLTVYTSAAGHYSIRKNMGILGLGRRNQRDVPVDESGRLRVDALRRMIAEDRRNGARPIMINATAGTTVLGAFDPLREISEVAAEERIWLHVDGSFGASVLFCDKYRGLLDGIERTDSLTWSPHKMMGMPLLCSVLLLADSGLLEAHFAESADYLFQSDHEELDPGNRSIQCGRRNDALKLWVAWQYHGDAGYAQRVRRQFALAHHAARAIDADPELRLLIAPASINVCFEVIGKSSVRVCERLRDDGHALVGHAHADGRTVIRLVTVNPELTEAEIDEFLRVVKQVARLVPHDDAVSVLY